MDVTSTVNHLADRGIRVHCLQLGGMDFTSPAGAMTVGVLAHVAQFERDLIIERTKAGQARARASGVQMGRRPALTAEQKAAVLTKIADGETISKIAKAYRDQPDNESADPRRVRAVTPYVPIGAAAGTHRRVNPTVFPGKVVYRRFRDGAALEGPSRANCELSSHAKTVPELRAMPDRWTALAESGAPIKMRKFVIPTDPIFDSATAKRGLLGPKLAKELAYVYEQIRVVRGALLIIAQQSKEMESDEVSDRLAGA
jgi:hypothetical protein